MIAGNGRTADILADALRGKATNERAKKLPKSGTLQYISGGRRNPRAKKVGLEQ